MSKCFLFFIPFLLISCIGEDVVDDVIPLSLRITSRNLESLKVGDDFQFEAIFTNNTGKEEEVSLEWSSLDEGIADINDSTGLATGVSEGNTQIYVSYINSGISLIDSIGINISQSTTFRTDTLRGELSGSTYDLRGDFELTQDGDDLIVKLLSNYSHDGGAPGPYLYLSNNRNEVSQAKELGDVKQTASHTFRVENVGLFDYQYLVVWCKPFEVLIGNGKINE